MYIFVFYDVCSPKVRRHIVKSCENYGLDRTQYSAYVGDLTRAKQQALMHELRQHLGDSEGALLLVPISEDQWQQRLEHRQNAPGDGFSTFSTHIAERQSTPQLY